MPPSPLRPIPGARPGSPVGVFVNPHMFPGIEDARDSPDLWNKNWEEFYQLYPFLVEPLSALAIACTRKTLDGSDPNQNEDMYNYLVEYRSTCEIRHRIGAKAAEAFAQDDLEEKWMSASAATRRRHALIAMASAASQARYLNDARSYCPDIMHTEYLGTNGQVLLDLLKAIIPNDISPVPRELHHFPERTWDALRRQHAREPTITPIERSTLVEVLLYRTKLIYLVAEGMLDSLFGRPLPQVLVHKHHAFRSEADKKSKNEKLKGEMRILYGEDRADMIFQHELAFNQERRNEEKFACDGCGKEQGEGEKFLRCSKCWKGMQREVCYCSRDCQTKD
ncbi:hypothetical protein BDW22DRAFT_342197 [Trametopsis cervina]|nr:hypothetical protein BDW22DRAFT_342197 [Trametopsis cervina]